MKEIKDCVAGDKIVRSDGKIYYIEARLSDLFFVTYCDDGSVDKSVYTRRLVDLVYTNWKVYEEPKKPWSWKDLKEGDTFWRVNLGGHVDYSKWENTQPYIFMAKSGNCFETREEAENYYKEIMAKD